MSHLSILILAATLDQAPAGSVWLDSLPPEANIVLRVRGLDATNDHLVVMLEAMSPALAARARPAPEQAVVTAKARAGEQVATEPFSILLRGVPPEGPSLPPHALILDSSDDEAVLGSIAGVKDPGIKHLDSGYDSLHGPGGQTWHPTNGDGFVAFGGDRILVGGRSKPGHKAPG